MFSLQQEYILLWKRRCCYNMVKKICQSERQHILTNLRFNSIWLYGHNWVVDFRIRKCIKLERSFPGKKRLLSGTNSSIKINTRICFQDPSKSANEGLHYILQYNNIQILVFFSSFSLLSNPSIKHGILFGLPGCIECTFQPLTITFYCNALNQCPVALNASLRHIKSAYHL